MLSLTRKTDYALVAMAELARQVPKHVSARDLSVALGVRLPILTNILHRLMQHGLVESIRGVRGGYRINKPASSITLMDLIDAMEGQVRLAVCCWDEESIDSERCDLEDNCRIRKPLKRVHDELRCFLSAVTLERIAFEAEEQNYVELGARPSVGTGT